jgi:diguanylate cyclase (GGDEF)-like protein
MSSLRSKLGHRLLLRAAPLTETLSVRQRRLFYAHASLVLALGAVIVGMVVQQRHQATLSATGYLLLDLMMFLVAAGLALRGVRLRRDRAAWLLTAGGAFAIGMGWLLWGLLYGNDANPPILSVVDVVWLAYYPLVFIAVGLMIDGEAPGVRRDLWLDGLVAAGAIAAFAEHFLFQPLLASVGSSHQAHDGLAVGLAYPVCDLVVLSCVVFGYWMAGGRLSRRFLLMGAAALISLILDVQTLVLGLNGTYQPGPPILALSLSGGLMILGAAWRRERRFVIARQDELRLLAVPLVFTLASAGLLMLSAVHGVEPIEAALAGSAVAIGALRFTLTMRDVIHRAHSQPSQIDHLTGLPTWDAFQARGSEMLEQAGDGLALLLMDLDRFKDLNDTLGHRSGDDVLAQVAKRFGVVREPGELLARMGGDEFAVLSVSTDPDAFAMRYRNALTRPFQAHGIQIHVEASAGVARYPEDGERLSELLQRADVAMFTAKTHRIGHKAYDAAADEHSIERLSLLGDLHAAIAGDQLVLHYQPKIDIATGTLAGVEALVRWQHPTRGLLGPNEFIPALEQTTLTGPLTAKVIDLALAQCRKWLDAGREIPIAVNTSAPNLVDPGFPQTVARLLEKHGVDPSLLLLEITETAVAGDPLRATDTLRRLRTVGVEASLDDFGTGYSSLLHLKQLAVSELKVDRSFVAAMLTSPSDAEIVRSTIELARRLAIRVVGEGVERPEELAQLAAHHCDVAQGYLFSRPVPAPELERWIDAREQERQAS